MLLPMKQEFSFKRIDAASYPGKIYRSLAVLLKAVIDRVTR